MFKAKGKGARHWKRKKGKGQAIAGTASAGGAPAAPTGKGQREGWGSQRSKANDVCMHCHGKGHWKRECPLLLSNPSMFVVEVLERSRRLSKDGIVLRLGDGKAIAVEAVGSLSLVISNRIRIELIDCFYVPNMHARLGHISKDRIRSLVHDEFYGITSVLLGYTLETVAKLLNIAPSRTVPQTPYEIWHGKPASYKYLRLWGSPAYVKRLVGDKLDSRSNLCRFIGYPKETTGYHFYDSADQKIFISRNAVFLEKDFPSDSRRDEVFIEESSEEPQTDEAWG
ncbi:UNVERIFIED_CONTAM: hypothetical protein Sradi_5222300 [Sesamum radiatum]|uniref:CCHC-type domain-containing protein n=1 Tax=Sesamum radiatum TaxID=300843 RepID=A0AAW2LKV8_SESRA